MRTPRKTSIDDQYRLRPALYILTLVAVLVLAACGPSAAPVVEDSAQNAAEQEPALEETESEAVEVAEATAETMPEAPEETAYPAGESYAAPVIPTVVESYPAEPEATPVPESYPAATEEFLEPRFRIDGPIQPSDAVISGQAPPGMALAIVDVTFNGELLGTGVSDADGRFSVNVADLVAGNRIGVTFAELEEGLTIGDMSIKYFPHRGEGFMNLPNVGIMLDTLQVES